ncbi:hypothetical protein GCM10010145_59810 [Streptomyces ruber]|uniref:Pyruvate phosphate dikinase AMP/ATP-binding domain-containing protein n=2 Tax=Streptomyces TaxID=1883 RepID=A0A918EWH4_9ACTN|nr:PEP/pyruvate-binding domain-containing protein [Streptomyces ruber]GGQ82171.1 hypothetical protein GCM10010145_59810 [Streptomyces ruber]
MISEELGTARHVYDFAQGGRDLAGLLGGKGANLAETTRPGLPVPPGFVITTEACRAFLAAGTEPRGMCQEVSRHLSAVSRPTPGGGWGSPTVRCWCPCVPGPGSPCPA